MRPTIKLVPKEKNSKRPTVTLVPKKTTVNPRKTKGSYYA